MDWNISLKPLKGSMVHQIYRAFSAMVCRPFFSPVNSTNCPIIHFTRIHGSAKLFNGFNSQLRCGRWLVMKDRSRPSSQIPLPIYILANSGAFRGNYWNIPAINWIDYSVTQKSKLNEDEEDEDDRRMSWFIVLFHLLIQLANYYY